ncbi:MAG: aldehyde ferredoxin oxidoreductase C-terminal domain-containing protein [Dehalococcoidia bacterium]|mgnify:CR=1 FL=1|jgi:aldehyde:ferredoxin oxidoreductase|nr:aldehyde ferredoxin oxidoreductase C-terminal domain-containing protein [Dehalococcoidia bacterium]
MSGAGPAWQGVGFERLVEPDMGFPEPQDPWSPDDKGRQSYLSQMKKMWEDCTGCCWYATSMLPRSLVFAPKAVAQATGWHFDREKALALGERIINLQRLLSLYLGFDAQNEFDLGSRVAEAPPSGPAQGKALGPHLKGMREEYYSSVGWDPDTGAPSDRTLEKVGLGDYRVGRS